MFTFEPNEFFKNTELTKTMIMDTEDDEMCKETIGCEIQWNEGKDTTKKIIKKKQKNKSTAPDSHPSDRDQGCSRGHENRGRRQLLHLLQEQESA